MDKLSDYITEYIIKDSNQDYEVIKYGVDAILSTVLCFTITLIFCGILNDLFFGCFFILFLTPIKMQFSGYHCSTLGKCILTYGCSVSLFLIGNRYIFIPYTLYMILLFILTYLVRSELTRRSTIIVIIYILLGTYLYYYNVLFYQIISMAILFDLILIVLNFARKQHSIAKG